MYRALRSPLGSRAVQVFQVHQLGAAKRLAPGAGNAVASSSNQGLKGIMLRRLMATQSDGSAKPPTKRAWLVLEDGTRLEGYSFGADKAMNGEVVFSTGMVGYTESLTDPSYRRQILTLTTPMVGNYGVPDPKVLDELGLPKAFESYKIHAAGLVVQDYSHHYSHWNAHFSLGDWLKQEGIPAISGIDTRMLTKKIRSRGAMLGRIEFEDGAKPELEDVNKKHLVEEVSVAEPRIYGNGNEVKILAVDCGIKYNIIRHLVRKGAEVKVVPWDHDIVKEMEHHQGLFLSNGPGDPTMCGTTVEHLKKLVNDPAFMKPIFGICLGNQLLGLAAGAKATKLPFGNRGQNQPVINMLTGKAFITPQNHGFAIDDTTLPAPWKPLFRNLNDHSNEGILHTQKPIFSAQFHPEAAGGPTDTEFFFDVFLDTVREQRKTIVFPPVKPTPVRPEVRKVLLLGSGGLSIGQAGEFDYSGAQAIKALKEEGLEVVLMNPNIASVQTNVDDKSSAKADQVYFLPVNPDYVEQVIKRERPDGLVLSMGGQTALNCGLELHHKGILAKYNVKVLGTQIDAIEASEDRQLFSDKLNEINEKIAPSITATTIAQALTAAEKIGYPCMIRSAYALGGLGSGICRDEAHLEEMAEKALSLSSQILVEKSLKGWKEVEYEVVRDAADNCITVCNMENFDPLGVHTGDSIVVAPSQTLSNEEYHMLRETALKVVRHLGIVGECNIQYALDPYSLEYCIIEVNARLSRSSALASKATGYPLAFVAAKLSLGITLPEIQNSVTKSTQACFEPSLDYIVTKIPRWDLSKFQGVATEIGSSMKSVGEVMAIGRTWEECIQKAMRMVDPAIEGFQTRKRYDDAAELEYELTNPSDKRLYAIAQVFAEKTKTVEEIHELTAIDHWFLRRLERISQHRDVLVKHGSGEGKLDSLPQGDLHLAKKLGYSDRQLGALMGTTDDAVRAKREAAGIVPAVKQIDTLAAEYPAKTNYLYCTYNGQEDDVVKGEGGVIVLGSGTYRIGSSVEFDWCGVSAIRALRGMGYRTTMVNYNPETVSTDYDECDQLYFDELSKERIVDIYNREGASGVVVSVGGQIPNNLAMPLHRVGVKIMGTTPEMIDQAEDRAKFSALMESLGIQQPAWKELADTESALAFAAQVGYPVLVRPSYVLSGAAMSVAFNDEALLRVLAHAADVSQEHPVVITKFVDGANEIEMDAVAQDGVVVAAAMHEHVENAGVHSGDATLMLPPQRISTYTAMRVNEATKKIAKALNITGPFNMQFLSKGKDVSVIECNLRASRSVPFVSKTMGVDFIEAAARCMVGEDVTGMNLPQLGQTGRPAGYVGVKAPMFSFTRLRGADPVLGVEMASTGEVACFGANIHEAFLKALISTGFKVPEKNILFSVQDSLRDDIIHSAFQLHSLGYNLYATKETYDFLQTCHVPCHLLHYPNQPEKHPNVLEHLKNGKIDLVINLPTPESKQVENNYLMRRTAVDFGVPLLTNIHLTKLFAEAITKYKKGELIGVQSKNLFDYYDAEAPEEAWTSPSEFH